MEDVSWDTLYQKCPSDSVDHTGFHHPDGCTPEETVALIVGYRDREQHLRIFLNNIIPFVKMQGLGLTVYVVEQVG